jgi:hypothetical protein
MHTVSLQGRLPLLTLCAHNGWNVVLPQVRAITSGVLKMEDGIGGFGSIHDKEVLAARPSFLRLSSGSSHLLGLSRPGEGQVLAMISSTRSGFSGAVLVFRIRFSIKGIGVMQYRP